MSPTTGRGPIIGSEWLRGADRLVRELRFRDYESALRFATLIGQIEDFGHHADICVYGDFGGRVRLTVANHNRAGITEQELRLASKIDAAIGEHYDYAYGEQPEISQASTRQPEISEASTRKPGTHATRVREAACAPGSRR